MLLLGCYKEEGQSEASERERKLDAKFAGTFDPDKATPRQAPAHIDSIVVMNRGLSEPGGNL